MIYNTTYGVFDIRQDYLEAGKISVFETISGEKICTLGYNFFKVYEWDKDVVLELLEENKKEVLSSIKTLGILPKANFT